MALTNPKKVITVEQLDYYNTQDKAKRATEIATAVATETSARQTADATLQTSIDAINTKIPSAASATNQLADIASVDDKISTSEATFRGNFATKAALDAYTGDKDKNDTAVVEADETLSGQCSLYQYSGTAWEYKYKVRDTALTADQIAALNSGITSSKVSGYDSHLSSTANPHGVTIKQACSALTLSAGKVLAVNSSADDFVLISFSASSGIKLTGTDFSADACANSDIDEIFA